MSLNNLYNDAPKGVPKEPTRLIYRFGDWDKTKVKVFFAFQQHPDSWLTARRLAMESGIRYGIVAVRLLEWVRLEYPYVSCQHYPQPGKGIYRYHLLAKGYRTLYIASKELANYNKFVDELMAWQVRAEPVFDQLKRYHSTSLRQHLMIVSAK